MDESNNSENIFKSLDLFHIVSSIKNAVTAGHRSEEMWKMLSDTFEVAKKITRASDIRLYYVDGNMEEITLEYDDKWDKPGERLQWKVDEAPVVVAKALRSTKELGSDQQSDKSSREEPRVFKEDHTLCISPPAIEGKSFFMLEMSKIPEDEPFSEKDEKTVGAILVWLDENLRSAISSQDTMQEGGYTSTERVDLILNVHRTFLRFCFRPVVDHESRDAFLEDLMGDVNQLLGAERTRLIVFEEDKDVREEEDEPWLPHKCKCYESHSPASTTKSWQRKSIVECTSENDVAWHAAKDNNAVNVIAGGEDKRSMSTAETMFNKTINNVFSFPINGETKVIGAVNVISKLEKPNLTALDEEACTLMAEYFSFILRNVGLSTLHYELQLRNVIAQDMLSYQLTPTSQDLELLVNSDAFHVLPEGFSKLTWYPLDCEDLMEQLAFFMMKDLVDEVICPDRVKLAKLVIYTKNMCNPACFHDFKHALSVLHSIYVMINKNVDQFHQLEVTDLFDNVPSEDYQRLMDLITHCSSGINLTVAFEKALTMKKLLVSHEFDPELPLHRSLVLALMISTADLSGVAKPIDVAMMFTRRVYREFYEIGDIEKGKGLCPVEKMNKDFSSKIHQQQQFYLTKVVKPIFEVTNMVLSGIKPLMTGIETMIDADHSHYEAIESYLKDCQCKQIYNCL
ncbi:probable 3',5'-cyclic phosphodiesterase pde-5 isoform X2 [Ischnura elegans]|uniref:probable 3',5'-cyclic phosphodiesterase pde-5 isoform X2 n=1 Tax=Ischnura elegans TaxID=197161 RepID=UPI001ED8A4D1|nr:probable 3',5'-cyclic phosphodiesterase pde-5 isoform X2 [Ischnura elegans]